MKDLEAPIEGPWNEGLPEELQPEIRLSPENGGGKFEPGVEKWLQEHGEEAAYEESSGPSREKVSLPKKASRIPIDEFEAPDVKRHPRRSDKDRFEDTKREIAKRFPRAFKAPENDISSESETSESNIIESKILNQKRRENTPGSQKGLDPQELIRQGRLKRFGSPKTQSENEEIEPLKAQADKILAEKGVTAEWKGLMAKIKRLKSQEGTPERHEEAA